MRIYLFSFLFMFALLGCEKRGAAPEAPLGAPGPAIVLPTQNAPAPAPAPAPGADPYAEAASPPSPHPSGAPVPFMQQLAEYKGRLEKNPKDIEALVFLGNANFDIQRYEKAKEFYVRALEVDPNNHFVRTDLASTYRNLGEPDQALNELNKVLKSNPDHETALYNSGVIYLNDKKDKEKAVAAWSRLVRLKPDDPESKKLQAKIDELKSATPK